VDKSLRKSSNFPTPAPYQYFMTREDVVRLKYEDWHASMSVNERSIFSLPWYQTVLRLLPDLSGKRIIEVGCGRGVFANYLATKYPGAKITAIDFSEKAIEIAKENYRHVPNLTFEVGNAESLHHCDRSFDFYISCETLEHVHAPQKMIGEIRRLLVPNGRFIVTTENYFNAYLLMWCKCWLLRKPFDSGSGIQPNENFFLFPMITRWVKKSSLTMTHTESNHYQWLLLPRVSPVKLCTTDFKSRELKWLFKPFGRHFTYVGTSRA
jgi:ubiquinone/menaquinone biosynthesis C-methylase UbiE